VPPHICIHFVFHTEGSAWVAHCEKAGPSTKIK
jgi:hypothetical protein